MSFRSSATIVASPRPRVGKTLLARLLTDFHLHEGRSVAAYDLNAGERTLAQFLPEKTTIATIRDINGQMALFDRLVADEDTTKVIDLGHESYESFFGGSSDWICRGSEAAFGRGGDSLHGNA